jgi:hypothetical protein
MPKNNSHIYNPAREYTYYTRYNREFKCGKWTYAMWAIKYKANMLALTKSQIKEINKQNADGMSALMIAVYNIKLSPSEYIRRIQLLIDAGADLYLRSNYKATALDYVVSIQYHYEVRIKIIELLLSRMNLKTFSDEQLIYLYQCVDDVNGQIWILLLKYGFNYNIDNKYHIYNKHIIDSTIKKYLSQYDLDLIIKLQTNFRKYICSPEIFFTTARGIIAAAELDNIFGEYEIKI